MSLKITEQHSNYTDLEKMSTGELLRGMNEEDKKVAVAVEKCLPQVEKLVDRATERMRRGGRLFYLGAGTSGRIGILDASELPPTYGVPAGMVIGLIAGGDTAIRKAVENAEDDALQGWRDLCAFNPTPEDTVIGIAASGTTPYVIGAVREAGARGILTGCITCNPEAPLIESVDIPIVAEVGPEFVTGSTRMKSGTAEKLILNMISTSVMIKLGHVKGNELFDMQLTNKKLVERGTRMIMEATGITDFAAARALLLEKGSVRCAIDSYNQTHFKN